MSVKNFRFWKEELVFWTSISSGDGIIDSLSDASFAVKPSSLWSNLTSSYSRILFVFIGILVVLVFCFARASFALPIKPSLFQPMSFLGFAFQVSPRSHPGE